MGEGRAIQAEACGMPRQLSWLGAMEGIGEDGPRLGRMYSHFISYSSFSVGAFAAWLASGAWNPSGSMGCMIAIAWFPFAGVELFRRSGIGHYAWPAAILSAIAGYDGVLRLVGQHGEC